MNADKPSLAEAIAKAHYGESCQCDPLELDADSVCPYCLARNNLIEKANEVLASRRLVEVPELTEPSRHRLKALSVQLGHGELHLLIEAILAVAEGEKNDA